MATGIVDRLAQQQRWAGQVWLGQGVAAAIDQHLQFHAQFAAVAEDGQVMAGQACSAGVEEVARVELDGLCRAVVVLDTVALAQGPDSATDSLAGLQHGDREAGLAQFVS
ncbi:hypothetical protein D3C76_1477310 [compost metagenome]